MDLEMDSYTDQTRGVDDRMVRTDISESMESKDATAALSSASGLPNRELDPSASRDSAPKVCLDPEVEFQICEVAGVTITRASHGGTGQHFQFGSAEYHVAKLLNGERTTAEIVQTVQEDGLDWTAEDVAEFIAVLVAQKVATVRNTEKPPIENTASDEESPKSTRPSIATSLLPLIAPVMKGLSWLISLRLPLVNANRPADRVLPWMKWSFTQNGLVIAGSFIAISLFFASLQSVPLANELRRVFDSQLWIGLIVLWAAMKLVHEMGHAVAARAYGVQVGKAGVMFFLFAPLAYVDVSNAWRLPSRFSRAAIAMAGVYWELLIASVAYWVWCAHPSDFSAHIAAQVFLVAGPATLLVNANPLLRLDGYYVLSDWADVPNLREQGRKLFGGWLQRKLFGMRAPSCKLTGWRRPFAAWHAAASVVFQVVWMGGLVVVVSMWAGPLGMLMATAAVMLWVLVPSVRLVGRVWNYQGSSETFSKWSHRRRAIWTCVTLVFVGQFLVTLPSPLSRPVPVAVQFANDQVLRSPINGFVDRVVLGSGEAVMAGQVILELRDDELVAKRDATQLELAAEEINWQRHEGLGELGLAEAARQKSDSLRRSLKELNAQVDSLRVVAQRDGEILTTNMDDLENSYVRQGQELVHIGVRQHMELLISVGEKDLDAYRATLQKGEAMQVLFRGGQVIEVAPGKLQPRASREIPHPAMSATVDGPLPVAPAKKQGENADPFELLTPRFQSIVALSPALSDRVRAGEVGQMALRDPRSVGRRFWEWFSDDSQ